MGLKSSFIRGIQLYSDVTCICETFLLSLQLTILPCVTRFEGNGSYLQCSYYVRKRERERERRGRYKLHEQFCNRAERPNCFAPSASRMCYRWMASGRGNVETRERLGGKLHYMTPRRVVIYVATATHLNRGTKMFVGSIYSSQLILSLSFPLGPTYVLHSWDDRYVYPSADWHIVHEIFNRTHCSNGSVRDIVEIFHCISSKSHWT